MKTLLLSLFIRSSMYMNEKFLFEQMSKKTKLDDNLKQHQHTIDVTSRFTKVKSITSNLTQKQIPEKNGLSHSTTQSYRDEI